MSELKVHRFITTDELFPEANAGALYYDKSEADKEIARYKHKRCLDMAYKCAILCQKSKDLYRWAEDENLEHHYNHKIEFYARWHKLWLELAEKFKEAK